jgi:hypothetical protein
MTSLPRKRQSTTSTSTHTTLRRSWLRSLPRSRHPLNRADAFVGASKQPAAVPSGCSRAGHVSLHFRPLPLFARSERQAGAAPALQFVAKARQGRVGREERSSADCRCLPAERPVASDSGRRASGDKEGACVRGHRTSRGIKAGPRIGPAPTGREYPRARKSRAVRSISDGMQRLTTRRASQLARTREHARTGACPSFCLDVCFWRAYPSGLWIRREAAVAAKVSRRQRSRSFFRRWGSYRGRSVS